MKMLGAEVRAGRRPARKTLKDAMNEALRDWVTNVADTFYCIGTVAGPHPYPAMVRDFQSIIGRETREQMQAAEGRLPDSLIACIGGGSNAMGLFHPFLDERAIEIYGVEAAGHGLDERPARGLDRRRPARRAARQPHLSADGRRRPDRGGAFDLRRPRLSRHRAGARLAQRHGPGEIPVGDRRRGGGGVPALQQARRHHPGARAGARARARARPRADKAEGSPDGGQPLRPRRQGSAIGRRVSGKQDDDDHPHRPALRRAEAGRPRRAGDLHHGGRSRLRDLARDRQGAAGGRRRRDRARHAVHRSDGRRPGDPGRRPARAQGRPDA